MRDLMIRGSLLGGLLLAAMMFSRPGGAADESPLGLPYKDGYDILIGGGTDCGTQVNNVEIMGFRKVYDKVFLVIRTDSFDSRRTEGMIAFDQVRAILPSHRTSTGSQRGTSY